MSAVEWGTIFFYRPRRIRERKCKSVPRHIGNASLSVLNVVIVKMRKGSNS